MQMIPEEKIQEVIDKADIVSVISKYTKVEKHGKEYSSLCLFHSDSNPSMNISPDKKIFKCFSCGVGGNVIAFYQKYLHISFVEAVVKLADEYGVDLGNIRVEKKKEEYSQYQKTLFAINEDAMKYYQAVLFSQVGLEAKKYVDSRNISKDEIFKWGIGYAYENNIVKHLTEKGYKVEDIVNAGLATKKDEGVFDYFRNRVVFPIKNKDGFITGFSGRVIGDEKPKYLNTRETEIFKKSEIMYNIDNVWPSKERYDNVILLEGFMDVISLTRIGIDNALALMGTTLSDYHINILKGIRKPVKLFLDGDAPGVNAMYKNSPKLIKNKIPFSIVNNPTTNDPDELINDGKQKDLEKYISKSINPYEYFIDKWNQEARTVDEKNEIVDKIFEILKLESNLLTIDSVKHLLSEKLNISTMTLEEVFRNYKKTYNNQERQNNNHSNNNHNNDYEPIPFDDYVEPIPIRETKKQPEVIVEKDFSKERKDAYRARVFLSLVKSSDYLKKIEKNVQTIYKSDYEWQSIITVLISYYNMGVYDGDNTEVLAELLTKEPNVYLKKTGNNFINFLKNQEKAAMDLFPMTDKELQDIIKQSKLEIYQNELADLEKTARKLEEEIQNETDLEKLKELNFKKQTNAHEHMAINKRKISLLEADRKKAQNGSSKK